MWDTKTGEQLRAFKHDEPILDFGISPLGDRILAMVANDRAVLWDAESGEELLTFGGRSYQVKAIGFSPDGSQIIMGTQVKMYFDTDVGKYVPRKHAEVITWDADTGKEVRSFSLPTHHVNHVISTEDGRLLTVTGKDVILWNAQSGEEIRQFKGWAPRLTRPPTVEIGYSKDAKFIATSLAGACLIWNVESGKIMRSLRGHTDEVQTLAFSPDGRQLITGSADETAIIWDTVTGQKLKVLKGHEAAVTSAAFSPDGNRVVTGSHDSILGNREIPGAHAMIWDTRTGKQLLSLKDVGPVSSVSFTSDGSQVVTSGGVLNPHIAYGSVEVWNSTTGKRDGTFAVQPEDSPTGFIWDAEMSPDGSRLVAGSIRGDVLIWDPANGELLQRIPAVRNGPAMDVVSITFSADGKRLLHTGGEDFLGVTERNLESGEVVRQFPLQAWFARYSADEETLVLNVGDSLAMTATILDTKTGKVRRKMTAYFNRDVADLLSPEAPDDALIGVSTLFDDDGEQIGHVYSRNNGKTWAYVAPNGEFDASADALRNFRVRRRGTLEYVPLEEFREKYFRPGLHGERAGCFLETGPL